jgi:hypothetical protein
MSFDSPALFCFGSVVRRRAAALHKRRQASNNACRRRLAWPAIGVTLSARLAAGPSRTDGGRVALSQGGRACRMAGEWGKGTQAVVVWMLSPRRRRRRRSNFRVAPSSEVVYGECDECVGFERRPGTRDWPAPECFIGSRRRARAAADDDSGWLRLAGRRHTGAVAARPAS